MIANLGKTAENIAKVCTAFANPNRVLTFLALSQGEPPIVIAEDIGFSRAALQKHLEVLLDAGCLKKEGSGRFTKYRPTLMGEKILQELSMFGVMLSKQRKLIRLDQTIRVVQQGADLIETGIPFIEELKTNREHLYEEILLVTNPEDKGEGDVGR